MKRKERKFSYTIRRTNDPIIKIDTEFWYGACFEDDRSYIVTSDPVFVPWGTIGGGAWWFYAVDPKGVEQRFSASDMGIPGYSHNDGRPNMFCLSKEEREIVSQQHDTWLSNLPQDDHYGYY